MAIGNVYNLGCSEGYYFILGIILINLIEIVKILFGSF